jgi:transposase
MTLEVTVGRKSKYSAEFRAEAARLSREPGRSSMDVAADLGVSSLTIRRWRKEFEEAADPELRRARAEHAELVRLRRRVRVLEEEREILAKAAAFRDQETGRAR